ncbi:hypothetical protein BASA50_010542 [Batrachochytrium salamandrivorans]|uniref:Uncharacterized protein n=1 Tax=Batrachochytrium salamandrivorans TaxID=1357716 RepID=A0ABQ8EY46_9FUNG|nr:hypothetical protein BASA60_010720 [Batrachochytrium salamandrivorans]KAH6565681.1 hypothetical protein BASA62_007101 [Batrachochytrium salamandrivorans]KAH6580633.1 hypothetical protein BASA61_009531 [Batrachochytrium salamandrivorans]KAH6588673.1 hypothetical protein BASA50_010542 [Batrachochytrium salamandrivorans]KAH9265794.1 hypothetical protein BASA83_010925 [Batrachochytrium salamandrivorans]
MGSKAERFKSPLAATGFIGPGSYEINQSSCMQAKVMTKPTSVLGVCLNRAIRFPEIKVNAPGVGKYNSETFIDLLNARCTSTRPPLCSRETKDFLRHQMENKTCTACPGPGSYDANYAIGRNVSNDHSFAMLKSNQLKKRQLGNSMQIDKLRRLVEKDDIFTDKLACRRMAYLSLYYD